jgi:hypothetical protein
MEITIFPENGTFNNRYFSNRYFPALIYGIYHRIYRIYLIIYLFGSKLLLIFTNSNEYSTTKHFGSGPEGPELEG